MQLPVSALDTEAAAIGDADRRGAAITNAVDGIGVIAHALLLFLRTPLGGPPCIVAGNRDIGLVWLPLSVEGVASAPTASLDTQPADAVFAVLRQRDDVRHTTSGEIAHHFDRAEGLVPVGAFETGAELTRLCN